MEPDPPATELVSGRARRTLLIVDDEQGPRESLRFIFHQDYRVLLAKSGAEAIKLAREESVAAAVLDIRMAEMSGIELLHHLKRINPSTEVVMLTAYETLGTATEALRLGACDYLSKPFDLPTMRAAVHKAMQRHEVSLQIQLNNLKLQDLQVDLQNQKRREELVSTKNEIYASILHDINGPLSIISGFVGLIRHQLANTHRVEGGSLEDLKDQFARVARQTDNCIAISQRYLGLLKKTPEQRMPSRLNQILSDLGELLRLHPSMGENQLIVKTLGSDLTTGMRGIDLIQILFNLTVNALQAEPAPHRVVVEASTVSTPIPDAAESTDPFRFCFAADAFENTPPMVLLTVSDDGPGMTVDQMKKAFEPYFTTKPPGQGTGLGLAIVLRLVKEAHGAICIESAPGKGARFGVYLPVLTDPEPGSIPES